ncbi:hypothetical protein WN944_016249 [Citrus x changshan-huyou]|uniref:Uncharacterized protein n=1 Tax=Citrus x changshan-huyou TaxID=2935761 RepID=A0AAP0QK80_9ROSI
MGQGCRSWRDYAILPTWSSVVVAGNSEVEYLLVALGCTLPLAFLVRSLSTMFQQFKLGGVKYIPKYLGPHLSQPCGRYCGQNVLKPPSYSHRHSPTPPD